MASSSIWLVLAAAASVVAGGLVKGAAENEVPYSGGGGGGRSADDDGGVVGAAFKLVAECASADFGTCIGVKAVSLASRAVVADDVKLFDGVAFVRTGDAAADRSGRALGEAEIENSLPEEPSQKSSRLVDLFLDAALRFFKSHALQIRLPESASADIQRAFEQGRGKLKKSLLPIVIGIAAKVFAVVPIVLGGLALVATKALVLGKIAFVIAALVGMQKLFAGGSGSFGNFNKVPGGGGGGGSAGWSSGNSYANAGGWSSSGGPYYRSFNEGESAQDLAYGAQAPKS